jgi:hypothetical protein
MWNMKSTIIPVATGARTNKIFKAIFGSHSRKNTYQNSRKIFNTFTTRTAAL